MALPQLSLSIHPLSWWQSSASPRLSCSQPCGHSLSLLDFPSSPSASSSSSSDAPLTPIIRPQSAPLHVVCNAPLVAPIPLPYHSPTFLQFDLPDIDEDLSHPPYIKKAPKRKRDPDEQPDVTPPKRLLLTRTWSNPSTPTQPRRTKQQVPCARHSSSRSLQRHF